jgi:hypothetical protein
MGQYIKNKKIRREFNEKCKIYFLLSTNIRFNDREIILTLKMVLPYHAGNFFASKQKKNPHDFTPIASVVGESVMGHGIGGIDIPAKMVRLAKMQDPWSKRRQTLCITRSRGQSNQ